MDYTRLEADNVPNGIKLVPSRAALEDSMSLIKLQTFEMAWRNAYAVMFSENVPTQKCVHRIL